ncbi:hypothetical protein [Tardiphaga sp.]|uniref:hypothetical protein n=1 Tax=Tardiphaga sp. TaxID=1926292 RepID=UPI00352BA3F2
MLVMILTIYVHAIVPLSVLAALAAARWGGTTEKWFAWAFATAAIGQKLVQGAGRTMYVGLEPGVALLDFALFITFLLLSVRCPKTWLLIATAFQLLSASAHLARIVDIGMSPLAYAILMGSGGYPILILLAAGIVAKARQQAKMRPPVATG